MIRGLFEEVALEQQGRGDVVERQHTAIHHEARNDEEPEAQAEVEDFPELHFLGSIIHVLYLRFGLNCGRALVGKQRIAYGI